MLFLAAYLGIILAISVLQTVTEPQLIDVD